MSKKIFRLCQYTVSLEKPGFCLGQLMPYKRKTRFLTCIVTRLLLLFLVMGLSQSPITAQENIGQSADNQQLIYIWAGQSDRIVPYVPSPFELIPQTPTANITVNYIGSWNSQAQAAFEYAVSIWEGLLVSTVTIEVDAEWSSSLPPGALGGAGPYTFWRDFTNAPQANTWYPAAIANERAGSDLNGTDPEIDAAFSSTFSDWYFGTDGNPPDSDYDFVSVVLHELGHGLGFVGSMRVASGVGYWGSGTAYPFIYDRFTENGGGTPLLNYANYSVALAGQLTSGTVYFDAPQANAANGGSRPHLYAPGIWQQGSSYSHLDESTFVGGTSNALMTPIIYNGEANHNPGPITLGMFQDMGWILANQNTAPTMNTLPGQLLLQGTTRNNAIDLWAYASDAQSADTALIFTIANSPNSGAGVSIEGNRYIDIFPDPVWTGVTQVTVSVTDPGSLQTEQTFVVAVLDQIMNVYLPLTSR